MNDRKTLAISEMKVAKWYEQDGRCLACGEPLAVQEAELAHRIPQRKWLLKMYGPGVIHHSMNVCLTHHGDCNDKMSLGNHPIEMEKLAAIIRKEREK
ncbi:hypothetical protein [Acidithiobacillus sp.]|uniref:hypothetical protein n=1 Tax=Acidithiobacillus sp. TaxID=1872118 RepID=UPI00258F315F|nr:hypothetical protein [Acidithiobacillus sp.]MDD5375749.1 hypothetical protein [Acidithiobacillus sp.]MDD5547171.1 hypothetical protein [Candidatus Omnitrophota bacterium]